MTDEKRKYCMDTIIPDLRNARVTFEELSDELNYRAENGIMEAREGWNDKLYLYSTEELENVEELWDEIS